MKIPLAQDPPLAEEEIQAAISVLRSGRLTQGEKVAEFEKVFAEAHGYPDGHAVFCNSGSSANLLAVTALDLKPGDEVIVPAVTWPTTVWPIVQCGGVPVLVDVDPATLVSRLEHVARAKSRRDHFIWAVHLLGNRCWEASDVGPLENSTMILEDCCEALGAEINGQPVGTFGRFGTFSFYLSHHITTIEGGMVLCRDAQDADRLRAIRSHGWTRNLSTVARVAAEQANPDIDPRFLFTEVGYNVRGTELAAAIGLVQFPKRIPWAIRRRAIAKHWTEALDVELFQPVQWAPGAVPFAFPLVVRGDGRDRLMAHLEAAGIETRPLVAGNLARQPAMRKVKHRIAGPLMGADFLHENALYVGLHPGLTDDQVGYLPQVLAGFRP